MKNGEVSFQGEDGSFGEARAGFPGAGGGNTWGGAGLSGGTCSSVSGGHEDPLPPTLQTGPRCPAGGPHSPGELPVGPVLPLGGRGHGEQTEGGPQGPR